MATIPLTFINEGATILRYFMYKDKAFNADLYLIALKRSGLSGKYELQFSGKLDMSKAKDNPLIGVEVPAKEGGIMSYIAANESVIYEIDSTTNNPDGEKVLFDGSSFRNIFDFVYGQTLLGSEFSMKDNFYATFPLVYDTQQGLSFGLVTNNTVEPDNFADPAIYVQNFANYLFYSINETTFKIWGNLEFTKDAGSTPFPPGFHVDIFFYTSLNRTFAIASNVQVDTFLPLNIPIPEMDLVLAPEEKLFLMFKRIEGGRRERRGRRAGRRTRRGRRGRERRRGRARRERRGRRTRRRGRRKGKRERRERKIRRGSGRKNKKKKQRKKKRKRGKIRRRRRRGRTALS